MMSPCRTASGNERNLCRVALVGRVDNFPDLLQVLIWNLKMVDGSHLLIDLFLDKGKTLVVCNVMMYEMHGVMMFSK